MFSREGKIPLEEVTVLLARGMGRPFWRTATGKRGEFRIPGVPWGEGYSLSLEKEGFLAGERGGISLKSRALSLGTILMDLACSILGCVKDAEGRAIPGASVELYPSPQRREFDLFWFSQELRKKQEVLKRGFADGMGEFRLPGLSPGMYGLKVSSPGFAPSFQNEISLKEGIREKRVDFILAKGALLSGVVRAEDGKPVKDARIKAVGDREVDPYLNSEETFSDKEGRFHFSSLKGGSASVFLEAEGYADEFIENVKVPAEGLEAVCPPGTQGGGTVLDFQTGRAVPGAKILACSEKSRALFSAVTDSRGKFELKGIPSGPFSFWVKAPGYQERREVQGGPFPEGGEIQIELFRGAGFSGRVLRAGTGASVKGASVVVVGGYSSSFGSMEAILTGEGGEYKVEGLDEGEYAVQIEAKGLFLPSRSDSPFSLKLAKGEVRRGVDFFLEEGGGIGGVVRDPEGKGIEGVLIRLVFPFYFSCTSGETFSGKEGTFTLAGIPRDRIFFLEFSAAGYPRQVLGPYLISSGETLQEIEAILPKGRELKGTVFDDEGRSLEGVRLTLFCKKGLEWSRGHKEGEVFSDENGRFRFFPLLDEPVYSLLYYKEGFLLGEKKKIVTGEELELVLTKVLVLAGRVLDEEGKPVKGVSVWAMQEGGGEEGLFEVTDEQGRFEFSRLHRGIYKMKFSKVGFRSRMVKGTPAGTEGLEVVLEGM